jgi:superfamily I DNA and/or RNA helicase
VIGATCLETGKPDFINGTKFDARFDLSIVDEVSKATPPELLLPCLLGKRTILVGDHRQLPPVFRESTFPEAIENGELNEREFESFKNMVTTSMFEVFYERADQSIKCGLCQQYRMHPQIMAAVNQFYADSPLSAGGGDERLSEDKKHQYTLGSSNGKPWLEPGKHLVWVDSTYTHDGKEVQDEKIGTSRLNEAEAMLCVHLLKSLLADESTVALISLYRAQIQNIERLLRDETDPKIRQFIENRSVNTVDQFQGSERDVVIVSLTRTDSQLTGEFIKDFRRINVAISRAKKLLIIIGRRETFDSGMVDVPSECGRQYEAKPVYREIREIARSLGGYVPLKVVLGQNAVHSRIHRSDGLASLEDELNASNL